MPRLSQWIIAYGVLLLAGSAIERVPSLDIGLDSSTRISAWTGGGMMLAAGFASMQRRRSLRIGGLLAGILIPLVLAGLFLWNTVQRWQENAPGGATVSLAAMTALLSASSIALAWIILRSRPRDDIASRGYAVPIPPKPLPTPLALTDSQARRSEAG